MIKRKLFVIIFLIWTSACIGQQAKTARTNRPLNIECSTPHNPIIMLLPVNQTICPGSTVTFTASAPIRDNYYWQMSKDSGITWIDTAVNVIFPLSNYVDSLTITNVSPQMNGYQFRCIFLGACSGFSRTTAATLTVKATPIQIDFQPISISSCNRTAADFQVKASGSSLSYQWQQKSNGENIFTDIPGKKAALLHFDSVSLSMNGIQYRCYVSSDCAAAVISNQCVLTVIDNSTTITSQPANQVVCNGDTSFFSIAVTGTNVRLQWQEWQAIGGYYADIPGANLPTLAIAFPASEYYYRCKIESSCNTLFSNSVGTRYIAPPAFGLAQEKYVCSGEEIYFSSIPYYGGNEFNFQWQVSADSGITYANIPGETSDYIYLHATPANNGSRYRCHTTNACFDGYSNVNKLYNVYIPTTITRQPTDKVACNGLPTSLRIEVTGSIASLQWQESTDGGISFSPSVTNGYNLTTPDMQLYNVTLSQNNYQYRCKIISYCGDTLYSNNTLLKVFTKPSLGHDTLIAVSCDTCTTDITHIFDTSTFAGLLWNTTHPSSVSMGKYYLKVFNSAGCNDSAFIYVNVHIVDTIEACKGAAVNITSAITGSTYQWEWDSYGNYSDIPEYVSAMENEAITGTRTPVLNMRGVDIDGRHIRCRINDTLYSHVIFVKQVAYWNGNVSNAWEEPLNWSCGVIPDYNTEVYILKSSLHNPEININAACKKILVANGSTLTVKEGVVLEIY